MAVALKTQDLGPARKLLLPLDFVLLCSPLRGPRWYLGGTASRPLPASPGALMHPSSSLATQAL